MNYFVLLHKVPVKITCVGTSRTWSITEENNWFKAFMIVYGGKSVFTFTRIYH